MEAVGDKNINKVLISDEMNFVDEEEKEEVNTEPCGEEDLDGSFEASRINFEKTNRIIEDSSILEIKNLSK